MAIARQPRKLMFDPRLSAATAGAGDSVSADRCPNPTGAGANVQRNSQLLRRPGRRNPRSWRDFGWGRECLGTAYAGGVGYGTVYQLKNKSGWPSNPLYEFHYSRRGQSKGQSNLRLNGTLYGTTEDGGSGLGTVFNLRPYPTVCKTALCHWMETVLLSNGIDGAFPGYGDLLFYQGDIFGTTADGGNGVGLVYELTPPGS